MGGNAVSESQHSTELEDAKEPKGETFDAFACVLNMITAGFALVCIIIAAYVILSCMGCASPDLDQLTPMDVQSDPPPYWRGTVYDGGE